jgi:hypothetical protein
MGGGLSTSVRFPHHTAMCDVDADEAPGLLDQYGAAWAGGVLPDWYYHLT